MASRAAAIMKSRVLERVKSMTMCHPGTRAGGSTCDMLTNFATQN